MFVRYFWKNVVGNVQIEAAKNEIGETAIGFKINRRRDLVVNP